MAKQTYPTMKVTKNKTSLAALFASHGVEAPLGEVQFELQNASSHDVFVSYGDQTKLENDAGHPIPPFWKANELESFENVYIKSGLGLGASKIVVSVVS